MNSAFYKILCFSTETNIQLVGMFYFSCHEASCQKPAVLRSDWFPPVARQIKKRSRDKETSPHSCLRRGTHPSTMTGKEGLVFSDNENKLRTAQSGGKPPAWKAGPAAQRRTGFGIQELLGLNKEPPAAPPRRPLEALPPRAHILTALGHGGIGVGMGLLSPDGIHPFYGQPAFLEVLSEAQTAHLQPLHGAAHREPQMETQHSGASSGERLK